MTDFAPKHDFLIGIDSDGCVFDTMELKHKECFIPNYINHYDLQGISKFAREAAEFVNLYSKSRGTNLFPALIEQLDWLRQRPEVMARGVHIPIPEGLINECLFFPIIPGNEEASWLRLLEEGIDHFMTGTFTGAFQQDLLDEFNQHLPETPPWSIDPVAS